MKNSEETATDSAALSFVAFLLIPVTVIYEGFAVSALWGWHVVPFFGVKFLPPHTAIGISTLIGLVKLSPSAPVNPKMTAFQSQMISIVAVSDALLIGYLAR